MPVSGVARHVPFLRRYARALTGSQADGDALVQTTLESILSGRCAIEDRPTPKVGLFRALHQCWRADDHDHEDEALVADQRLQDLSPERRAPLLLTVMEGFSLGEAAAILELEPGELDRRVAEALSAIDQELATDVLIVEDEPIIAIDLERIVEELGHRVIGVAHTRTEGVELAGRSRPGLVLCDVHLADGSSGLDAAVDILNAHDVPVIFITAYPERLLTGMRPEPAYLVSKPYDDDQVKAVIGQALFFHRPGVRAA